MIRGKKRASGRVTRPGSRAFIIPVVRRCPFESPSVGPNGIPRDAGPAIIHPMSANHSIIRRTVLPGALIIAAVLTFPLVAQERPERDPAAGSGQPGRASAAEVYRPLAVPDRVILTWRGDPSRTQ